MVIKILVSAILVLVLLGLIFRFTSIVRLGKVFDRNKDTLAARLFRLNYWGGLFNTLFQVRLFKAGKFRWLVHSMVLFGFTYLVWIHALDDWTGDLFAWYQPDIEPFRLLRTLAGIMVLTGCFFFLLRRMKKSRINQERMRRGLRFRVRGTLSILVIIALIGTGFLTEGLNIMSEPRFDEMVEEYSGLAGEPELVHLKAYWARYYHVTFTQAPLPVVADREDGAGMIDFEEGEELNDSYCLECHTRPDTAFLSVPVAKVGSGLAPWLSRFRADRIMYWIHFGLALTLVLFFPFSRMFHLAAVPLASMGRRMTPEKMRTDMGFLDLAALSACTHCGYCTQVCSVYPDYQITENPQVLPHVKIETLKRLAGKGVWDLTTLTRLRSGNGDCTQCGMCGDICPSGIDLVKLWAAADHLMDCLGCPDNYTTAMETSFEQWTGSRPEGVPAQGLGRDGGYDQDPEQDAGQVIGLARQANAFEHCVQCTLCTNTCPVVAYDLNQNDMGPHQIMNLLRLGEQGMASGSKMVWHCLTCYSCQEVCPQSIRVADILLELRCQGQVRAAELTLHRLRGEDS